MRGTIFIAAAFLSFASPLAAQSIPFSLQPAYRNHPACATGNAHFIKAWSVTEGRTTATVSGATSVSLRKGTDGVFSGTGKVANSTMTFTFVNNGRERVLKVTSGELGCVWQGTNLDSRRA
ncbi:MAG: hypothetical protein IKE60_05180 [Reyranella sp.]|uniref:hypothetical protein n=1 Tax=Reyranella sp. TaxID=1929291 RepID=UPI001ACB1B05|nr:hypothetical protein [Reyranella sp.]MBN9538746.1 hypothetical protein [Alphaproteobacteria bacterium]MBR2814018.1 hypothetical protein [Reyranella sp.]